MITPDHKQAELSILYADALNLHRQLTLHRKVTRPMQTQMTHICEQIIDIQADLKKCRIYVPEPPRQPLKSPLHPTTNPHGVGE